MGVGVLIVVCLIALSVWLLMIEIACYRYFKEKRKDQYEFGSTLPASAAGLPRAYRGEVKM